MSSAQQLAFVHAVQVVSRIAVGQPWSPVVPLSVLVACGVVLDEVSLPLELELSDVGALELDSSVDALLDVALVPEVSAG